MVNNSNGAEGLRLADIYPIIEEKLRSGGEVTFKPHGTSMLPLIRQGRDSATIGPLKRKPQKLDVIFYRRDDGQFVLHRIIGENKDGFILCGDNQFVKEYGIKENRIIGVLTAFIKDGKTVSCEDSKYIAYCRRLWLRRIGLRIYRSFIRPVKMRIKRVFGK